MCKSCQVLHLGKAKKGNLIMALTKQEVSSIVKEYGANEKDSGNVKVQIALLTAQIKKLTEHMKANKHDYSSKRGLDILVGKRRGLLDYLKSESVEEYNALIAKLGLRK